MMQMARMVPTTLAEEVRSNAERKLFPRLRDGLGDDWFVLHSVGLARHAQKPWSEIDFVLIGPLGVLCLEVKGGRVARAGGIWSFVDRYGRQNNKHEGPFEQVGKGAAALYTYLKERIPDVSCAPLGYGVMFPDISFDLEGPDIITDVVYDEKDYGRKFEEYLKRVMQYWQKRLQRSGNLGALACTRVVKELRGDFDFRPSLRSSARDINEKLLSLTEEQYENLDFLAENERVLVRGGAGTGKTLLAVEETKRAAKLGLSTLYCCFNRLLAHEIRDALGKLRNAHVRTLHALCHEMIRNAGLENQLPNACEADLLSKFYPEFGAEALLKLHPDGLYDELVLDEAQDLLAPGYVDFLDLLLKRGLKHGRWRAFYDPKQDIFAGGVGRIRCLNEFVPARGTLSINCRNTRPIAVHAALLSGYSLQETLRVQGPDVEMHYFKDLNDLDRIASRSLERVLSQEVSSEDIVLLSQRRVDAATLRKRLAIKRPVVDLAADCQKLGSIGLCTISAFKGLERDVVMLFGLDDVHTLEGSQLLYVGASRARVLLIVLINSSEKEYVAERAKDFGRTLAQAVE
jgi:hypothetical protein